MKKFTLLIFSFVFIPTYFALAHEGGEAAAEFTDVASADWVGPLVAALLIVLAGVIAARIKKLKNK